MASAIPLGISKIGDYLESRDKHTNFGTCRRCDKKVYWSTNKVISHIRSGHCSGASEEEVDQFKKEYLYSSPKNLVHRSKIEDTKVKSEGGKTPAKRKSQTLKKSPKQKALNYELEHDEMEEGSLETEGLTDEDGQSSGIKVERVKYAVKRKKVEEPSNHTQYEVHSNSDDKVEFIIVSEEPEQNSKLRFTGNGDTQIGQEQLSKEAKFIQAVYPQFFGKTKLQLIDEILDAQRRNELLQDKVKTFEETINRLLN